MAKSLAERLWENVTLTDYCWLWEGYREQSGYGQIRTPEGKRKVHRVAFELLVGPITKGLLLDHRCRVRNCVRPSHLRQVTNKENSEHLEAERLKFGHRGVTFDKGKGKYRARIRHNYKDVHVGYFPTIDEAKEAVTVARLQYFTHSDGR